jgi:hypothetical protein
LSPTSPTSTRSVSEGHQPAFAGWRYALALTVLASLLAGCRTKPYVNAHIESVNAEYRQLEDYVYALEEENARLQQELGGIRSLGTTRTMPSDSPPARGGPFRRSPSTPAPRRSSPATDSEPGFEPPTIELPGETPPSSSPSGRSRLQRPAADSEQTAPADTPPSIELPARPLQNSSAPSEEALPGPPMPKTLPAPTVPEVISPKPADKKVTHLFLNPMSGGADFDGQPGDDGLRVVVEPRNAGDEFIPEAGALSVVLLDPDRQGEAARVARWDFDLSTSRQMLAASSPGRGIKLEVPWPAAPPATNRLKMFVRYEAPDGRRLQTDREIFITQPSQATSRWTPRSTDRGQPAELATAAATEAEPSSTASARPLWSPSR